jgi:hypothetical protein
MMFKVHCQSQKNDNLMYSYQNWYVKILFSAAVNRKTVWYLDLFKIILQDIGVGMHLENQSFPLIDSTNNWRTDHEHRLN